MKRQVTGGRTRVSLLLWGIFLLITGTISEGAAQQSQAPAPAVPGALAVGDQLQIAVADVQGLSDAPLKIEQDGTVTLPLVGKVRAEGLTVDQLRRDLTDRYSVYVRNPRVDVKLVTEQSQSIVVAGAFKSPGIYPLRGPRPLLEVISAVGGLAPNAGRTVRITRRIGAGRNPLPAAIEDLNAGVNVATVSVARLAENPSLRDSVIVEPEDIIFANPVGQVFLTGEVLKPGPFELGGKDSFGLAELIALGGGLGREAAPDKAKILRPILNDSRRAEIPVDVKAILGGTKSDFRVLPNDVVFVPRSKGKGKAVQKALLWAAPAVVTSLIYVALR
jgi:polysaccharide biosynthesis/export protein